MTVNERLEDISKISGFSVEIVRKVLNAEKESIAKSLKKGERATLIGRCTIEPFIRQKIKPGEGIISYIKLRASVSNVLSSEFEKIDKFETNENGEEITIRPGIATMQIESLI